MLTQLSRIVRHWAFALLLCCFIDASVALPDELNAYLERHPIHTVKNRVARPGKTVATLAQLNSQRDICPANCDETGLESTSWTAFHDVNRISWCNQTMLLDFALYNRLDDPSTSVNIRSCAAGPSISTIGGTDSTVADSTRIAKRGNSCKSKARQTQVQEPLQMAFNVSDASASIDDFGRAAQLMAGYLSQQKSGCQDAISFAYSRSTVIGFFAGSGIHDQGIADTVLQDFIQSIQNTGYSKSALVQLCSSHNRSSKYSLGIITNANADLGFVQHAVATWASGGCVDTYDKAETWKTITLSMPMLSTTAHLTSTDNSPSATESETLTHVGNSLVPRATDCSTEVVKSGDTCSSLAAECGITPAQFTQYNPDPNECSTLTPGEYVCCTAGTLPDYSPKPYSNGTCYTYLVQTGDSCSSIAASNSLTITQLENFNNNTWGWFGCADLQAAQNLCLSTGYPPMPSVVKNAICGPQVPGTPLAPAGTNYSTLNECPLNACCDIWGQCGTTSEFCTESQSATGAPGTAAVGQNGCISNCGTEIVTGSAPTAQYTIGYFEGFNVQRPCLNQPVQDVDLSSFTHVHMSFGGITSDYNVDISSIQEQFQSFVDLNGNYKKILSIGGWAFCTDPGTYNLFREAVTSANRNTFAASIASFVTEYNLDGIDLDWEYPGEPDIPGIPAGSSDDGPNYAAFLQVLASQMPSGTTVSFTAPASYWYLKAFPVAEMAKSADYVIFMTYDLHGQWDYGNKYSDPGCPGGNCLRSDVNLTETISALSMVTKAGVPANKIAVGVTSYGRSFQMTTAGCYTEECTYTGPSSGAYAGLCTNTNGYISNAEIGSIIAGNAMLYNPQGAQFSITGSPQAFLDNNSYSNIVVYDSTQWVGYMDDSNKATRVSLYRSYNFLGTADWAIDLASYKGDDGNGALGSSIVTVPPSIWGTGTPSIECQPPCIFVLPPFPLGYTTTISWPILTTTLLSSSANKILTVTTTITVPSFPLSSVSLQPITILPTQTETYKINPVQSITPTSFVFTLGPSEATFPPIQIPTSGASVGGPLPGNSGPSPTAMTSSSAAAAVIPPGVTFYTTPHPVTIQPQPTYSISFPPQSTPIPAITIQPGPEPSCTTGCGTRDCGIFGCGPGCGLFACNGGCGIFGCGGGCGVFGCQGECALDNCGGLNCVIPGSCGGAEGGGDNTTPGSPPNEPNDSCNSPVTVSACTYYVSSFTEPPMTTYTTTTSTNCKTTTTCDGEDSKTTKTLNACTASIVAQDSAMVATLGTTISGTYVPYDFLGNSGGSGSPTGTIFGGDFSSTTSSCDACTFLAGVKVECTAVAGCTKTTTTSHTSTIPKTTTVTASPPPHVEAQCSYWFMSFFPAAWYEFEVYNIQGDWPGTSGSALQKQEDGCGAVTGWKWNPAGKYLASAYFNLPLIFKAGCVERAIATAGGPILKCQLMSSGGSSSFSKRDEESSQADATFEEMSSFMSYGSHVEYDDRTGDHEVVDYETYAQMQREQRHARRQKIREYHRRRIAAALASSSSTVPASNTASRRHPSSIPEYSYSTYTSTSTYKPATWNTSATTPITFTWTYNSYSTIFVTTTTVIANATTIPIQYSSVPAMTSTQTTTSSVTPPAPTPSGTAPNCNQYYVVQSGDSCSAVESQFSITFQQFYAWNPAIGSNCQYLDIGEAYCVSVSGSTTSTGVTPPAPTQSGTAPNCTEYYVVQSGDSCAAVESQYNITFQQFYQWNPSLGSNCQYLDVGDAYCVAV